VRRAAEAVPEPPQPGELDRRPALEPARALVAQVGEDVAHVVHRAHPAVRAEVGADVTLITPGVRPAGAEAYDQARVATPEEALLAGADLLVIGRPITRAPDPGAAAAAIAASLRRVSAARDPV